MKTFMFENNRSRGITASHKRKTEETIATHNWIVMTGNLVNTTSGNNGFEFFGPFTEAEAKQVRQSYENPNTTTIAIQLLSLPRITKARQM